MSFKASLVQLSSVELHSHALKMRQRIMDKVGEEQHRRRFPDYESSRLCYVMELVKQGGTCLEIGPGRGYLSNMMARLKKFDRQVVVDIVKPSPNKFAQSIEYYQTSIADLDFPDRSFDTVICMEVLEHLNDEDLPKGLRHIRRVCRGDLIMSVPYLEPLPLPDYHKQRFDEARVLAMFPDADYSLLLKEPVTRVPWLLIRETY